MRMLAFLFLQIYYMRYSEVVVSQLQDRNRRVMFYCLSYDATRRGISHDAHRRVTKAADWTRAALRHQLHSTSLMS